MAPAHNHVNKSIYTIQNTQNDLGTFASRFRWCCSASSLQRWISTNCGRGAVRKTPQSVAHHQHPVPNALAHESAALRHSNCGKTPICRIGFGTTAAMSLGKQGNESSP